MGEHCTLRVAVEQPDWLGRVLPHPSYEAIELSHGPYVSGGATNGTRGRRFEPGPNV